MPTITNMFVFFVAVVATMDDGHLFMFANKRFDDPAAEHRLLDDPTTKTILFDNPTITLWRDLGLDGAKDYHPRVYNDRWPECPAFCQHPFSSYCPIRRSPETWVHVVSDEEKIAILVDQGFFYERLQNEGERELAGERSYGPDRPLYSISRVFGKKFLDSMETIKTTSDNHLLAIKHISNGRVLIVIDEGWKTIILEFIERPSLSVD